MRLVRARALQAPGPPAGFCALVAIGALGCGAEAALTIRDVPLPGVTMPYGLLAVDVELGDTRGARLRLKAPGYIDREIPLPGDGVYVLKMVAARWSLQVIGTPGRSDVITFDGTSAPAAGGEERAYPELPVESPVEKNHLMNAGHVCAHRTCKDAWVPFDHPAFQEWERTRRYDEAFAPIPPPAEETPVEK